MKKIYLLLLSLSILFSCSKDEETEITTLEKGMVSFTFSSEIDDSKKAKNLSANSLPNAVMLSLKKDGVSVYENEKLTLTAFNSSYITQPIELEPGSYSLSLFNIVDTNNVLLYASPFAGSEFAEYTDNPLPLYFEVTAGGDITISPQVIAITEGVTPEQFGFVTFSFEVITIDDGTTGGTITENTEDLYVRVYETIDGVNTQVEARYEIRINAKFIFLDGEQIYDETTNTLTPIKVPTTGDEIEISIKYKDYHERIFFNPSFENIDEWGDGRYLNDVNLYSAEDPLEIYLEEVGTTDPEIIDEVDEYNAQQGVFEEFTIETIDLTTPREITKSITIDTTEINTQIDAVSNNENMQIEGVSMYNLEIKLSESSEQTNFDFLDSLTLIISTEGSSESVVIDFGTINKGVNSLEQLYATSFNITDAIPIGGNIIENLTIDIDMVTNTTVNNDINLEFTSVLSAQLYNSL